MSRGGRKTKRDEPERRCIVTARSGPKAPLIRFVLSPDGIVTPDLLGKLPGRGMYVSAIKAHVAEAAKKNAFARSAKAPAKLPDDLAGQVEELLVSKMIETLSLAKKAGLISIGFDNTKSALVGQIADYLIQASDGSKDQKAKLRPPFGPESLITSLRAAELGIAFGREHVIHAALSEGGLTDLVVFAARRLDHYRDPETPLPELMGKP